MTLSSAAVPRALVFGESLVDIIAGEAFPGGSPLNVAVGLSRLGIPTDLATRFGDDPHGDQIAAHLRESRVRFAEPVAGAHTSRAEVLLNESGEARYRFALDSVLPSPPLDGIALVHTGSLGAVLDPGSQAVLAAFDARGVRLRSYDPNIRPDLMHDHPATLARVERLVSRSHIVKLSDEDAELLYPGASIANVLDHLLALGASLAVLTRGAAGCVARAGRGGRVALTVPAEQVEVVDTVGAGDSFMAALLAAVLDGPLQGELLAREVPAAGDIEAALEFAACAAGITSSRPGANPPWEHEFTRVR